MKTKLPAYLFPILQVLHDNGEEAFLVGGCVRDMLLQRPIHDYDITTSAHPDRMQKLFKQHGYKVILTGLRHGTITVLAKQEAVEITTYRIEHTYTDHRHPSSVCFTSDLKNDLQRRDFTMNAIAYGPTEGIFDPFHGEQDIRKQLIRCVGDPRQRFQEDALRILRAIRFQCELRFTLEQDTLAALKQNAPLLRYISKERIREEWNRMLMADYPNTLQLLYDTKVLPYILPGYTQLYDHEQRTPWHLYDIFHHSDIALNHTCSYPLESKLAIVFHDWGKLSCETMDENGCAHYKGHAQISEQLARHAMRALTYDKKTIERVAVLIRYHDYYVHEKRSILRRYVSHFDDDFAFARQALQVQMADDQAKNLRLSREKLQTIERCLQLLDQMESEQDRLTIKDVALNGYDLMAYGLQGKAIGDMLRQLYSYVLEDPTRNTRQQLQEYLLAHTSCEESIQPSKEEAEDDA